MDLRRNNGGSASYELKEVRDHHKEIIRRLVLGQRPGEIAEALGVHKQTVSNVRNDPTVSAMIDVLQNGRDNETSDIAKELAAVAPAAINLLKQTISFGRLAQDGPDAVDQLSGVPDTGEQIRAAKTVLDIVVPKKNIEERRHIFTGDLIETVKRRSLEAKQKRLEKMEDADYEDISESNND